ncbi:allophanate hydrolase subunit 1 [Bosea vestrisii]|uniref:5-oxoprolinase subunit B family protein n=1 Tax=Bosea vestrisii TaxID=151416 RepID=UPI0024DF479C|nr:allophanate hydrolase subunit 1 [Bosea vestrisii]WID95191.1 allophanate hydrolase subunit 1 [Bosea vestrisii]
MSNVSDTEYPRYRPVAERALLVEFGYTITDEIHSEVLKLDSALSAAPFEGFLEAIPAYASVLVCFDPYLTDHRKVRLAVTECITRGPRSKIHGQIREIEVCYDVEFAPDLADVAQQCGLTVEQLINAHLSSDYRVFMYGFAPGYAYLAGVPAIIQVPRKQAAVRDIPAGSVLIAGPQCLVTTLKMPTGWSIIGRSPTRVLNIKSSEQAFLFNVGDTVQFRRVSRSAISLAQS